MRTFIATGVAVLLGAGAAQAQGQHPRFYTAATTSIDGGNRGTSSLAPLLQSDCSSARG